MIIKWDSEFPLPVQADNSWGSWMVPLMACITATSGPILEVGMGDWSTLFLHHYCACAGRELVSIETDKKWAERYVVMNGIGHHTVMDAPGGYELYLSSGLDWSVIFIDGSPGHTRAEQARIVHSHTDYIVVHDYSGAEVRDKFTDEVLGEWKYRAEALYTPASLVLSDMPIPAFPRKRSIMVPTT